MQRNANGCECCFDTVHLIDCIAHHDGCLREPEGREEPFLGSADLGEPWSREALTELYGDPHRRSRWVGIRLRILRLLGKATQMGSTALPGLAVTGVSHLSGRTKRITFPIGK